MKENTQRAKIAIMLIWAVLVLDVLMALTSYLELDLLQRMAEGLDYTDEEADMNDLRVGIVAILYTIAYVTSIVTFIRWFRRAYYNLHTRDIRLEYTEGWAAGAWFVPFINLVRPYKIMKELYEKTSIIIARKVENYNKYINYNLIGFWWFMWIVGNFIANIETRITLRAETIEALIWSDQFSIFSSLIAVPLALLAIKVISDYSEMEKILFSLKDEDEHGELLPPKLNLSQEGDFLDSLE